MSVPQAVRAAGSSAVYATPVSGFTRACQKFDANGLSVSFPPMTQWFVMFFRCDAKLCIE